VSKRNNPASEDVRANPLAFVGFHSSVDARSHFPRHMWALAFHRGTMNQTNIFLLHATTILGPSAIPLSIHMGREMNALSSAPIRSLAGSKLRECSMIVEMKGRKSARMFGTGGRSQPESAREAGCCTHVLYIRRRATSVSTHALLSSSQAEARRLIFPRQESGRGFEQDPRSFFLSLPVE